MPFRKPTRNRTTRAPDLHLHERAPDHHLHEMDDWLVPPYEDQGLLPA